jgi:hypothetical protein
MNQASKSNRSVGGVRRDQIGKIFLVVSTQVVPLRQCLICEGVFTREEAREHYAVRCEPQQQTNPSYR